MGKWEGKYLEEISEELFPIQESEYDYISKQGEVYKYSKKNNKFYRRSTYVNAHNDYVYVSIRPKGEKSNKNRRLHVLLAKTFIENPKKYSIVGHRNNNKQDNSLSNLYWTTNQENTQKAYDDELNVLRKGIQADKSIPLVALKDNRVVGVYGSMGECEQCIENLTKSYLSKIIKHNGDYKPRGKRYLYKPISVEEYNSFASHLKGAKLIEITKPKDIIVFRAINVLTLETTVTDNQKQFAKQHGLKQAMVSQAILNNKVYGGFRYEIIKRIPYLESSGYNNLIEILDGVKIKNIKTGEIREYKTIKAMKDDLGYKGHGIDSYTKESNILMNEWKII